MTSDRNRRDQYIIRGSGFHCRLILDLTEVRSIRRTAYWNGGWWFDYNTSSTSGSIHVKESIDVLGLFDELQKNKST